MKLNSIEKGDCLIGLKNIPDNSVDLVLADPPYGINFQGRGRRKSFPKIANDKTPFIWWIYDAARVLKNTGSLICFSRWDVQDTFCRALEIAGLKTQNVCVWSKGGGGMGNLKASFAPDHEVFIFATGREFTFPGKRPASVLNVPKVSSSAIQHPNEKPVELAARLIETCTDRGAVVLDPFMGSGTTAVACLRTGRNYLGFELDERYFELAQNRIAEEVGNIPDDVAE